jgi:hypothetical protein
MGHHPSRQTGKRVAILTVQMYNIFGKAATAGGKIHFFRYFRAVKMEITFKWLKLSPFYK